MFPGIVFVIFFVLNLFIWGEKSSGAVPFGTMFALLVLWFGISVPLAFAGSYLGYKRDAIEYPTKTNLIPRAIPEQVRHRQRAHILHSARTHAPHTAHSAPSCARVRVCVRACVCVCVCVQAWYMQH